MADDWHIYFLEAEGKVSPNKMKQHLRTSVITIICIGLVFSGVVFFAMKNGERSNHLNEFTYKAQDHAAAIQVELEHLEQRVRSVRFQIEHTLAREQHTPPEPAAFMSVAGQPLITDPALLTLAWAVPTPIENRLHIIYVKHGSLLKAGNDKLKTGMYYDRYITNESLLRSKVVQITVHEENDRDAVIQPSRHLSFLASVLQQPLHSSAAIKGDEVLGVFIVEYDFESLIERAVSKLPVAALDIRLYRIDDSGGRILVHTHVSRSRSDKEMQAHTGYIERVNFEFSGLHLQLEFEAAPRFLHEHPIVLAWQSLVLTLLVTFFFVWMIYSNHYRNRVIREEVARRTNALARFEAIIEQADEIVVITDKNGIIEYVNPAFSRTSGFDAQEVIGQTPAVVKSGKHAASYYTSMWQCLSQGEVWREDFINRNKQGEYYTVKQAIIPIVDETGNITAFASVQRDITREQQMEQQLQHADRLDSLGMLAGGIAHDFNNILVAILGHASAVKRRLESSSSAKDNLDEIIAAGNMAAALCNQMLTYSGEGHFEVLPVNLSQTTVELRDFLEIAIPKGVYINCQLNMSLPAIDADVSQMQQVVMNLVTNAAESMTENREKEREAVITISSGEMYLSDDSLKDYTGFNHLEAKCYVYLEVSDTGCGMDEETIQKLFDPYFSTKFTGRGLGMSAVLGIVNGHHGGIKVRSQEGEGSCIRVIFPVSRQPLSEVITPSLGRSQVKELRGTVLVVDDDPLVRRAVTVMLEELGLDVLTANDGVEGVEQFCKYEKRINLVLLDLTMPKMDGRECFARLKQIKSDLPVLISSGYSKEGIGELFSGTDIAGFIHKPYSLQTLEEKIKYFL